jgi:putative MATE family efflux protein
MHSAMLLSGVLGIVLAVAGYFWSDLILQVMSTPADVFKDANLYMKIFFLGTPASLVYNFGAAILRAYGDTKRPMYILGLTGLVNVFLNLVLVIGMHRGVDGVAIATIVAQYLSAGAVLWILFSPKEEYDLKWRQLRLHSAQTRKMIAIGIPCGLNGMLFSISNVILQSSINSFNSADIIAGSTAATDINNFFYLVSDALCVACVSFAGQCYGARQYKRIDKLVGSATIIGCLILIVLATVVTCFPRPILKIFNSDPNVINAGIFKLIVCGWGTVLYAAGAVMTGVVRGMGKSLMPMLLNVFSICGVRLVWVLGVFPFYRSVNFLYLCYPISWGICTLAITGYYVYCRKKLYQKELPQNA